MSSGSTVYRNTPEHMAAELSFDGVVPEPATMALLVAGLPLLLRKRQRG
jgi:hypothetical protein